VFTIGAWKDFDELESTLTLKELTAIYTSMVEEENRHMKMTAAALGADVSNWDDKKEEPKEESVFDRAKKRMKKNRKPEGAQFAALGLGYEKREV
jgi:hypothetical protein